MKLRRAKKGFTIVELVIVIGVIGILSAILIPTFINVTENAKKSAMKSNCANAYSSYIAEATDGFVDNYYELTAGDEKEGLAIVAATQEKTTLQNKKGEFFGFVDGEWKAINALPAGALPVYDVTYDAEKTYVVLDAQGKENRYYKAGTAEPTHDEAEWHFVDGHDDLPSWLKENALTFNDYAVYYTPAE